MFLVRHKLQIIALSLLFTACLSLSPNSSVRGNMSSNNTTGGNLGFVGFGTIAQAIATGLLTQKEHPIDKVYISKRSESKSSALAEKFSDKVVICDNSQEIADECETLFLCVLPDQEEEVLKSLDLKEETTLVSLVSTSNLATLIQNSGLPAEKVYKMICLPAVADLEGTPLLVPRSTSPELHSMLSTLGGGTCIQCDNEEIMEAMMVSTCMMGPIYGLMRANRDFLIEKGVPPKDANYVVARQYFGMTKDALLRSEVADDCEDSLDKLISEQTPGGLNEQTLKNLEKAGALDTYEQTMEAVLNRIQGKTDGTMGGTK